MVGVIAVEVSDEVGWSIDLGLRQGSASQPMKEKKYVIMVKEKEAALCTVGRKEKEEEPGFSPSATGLGPSPQPRGLWATFKNCTRVNVHMFMVKSIHSAPIASLNNVHVPLHLQSTHKAQFLVTMSSLSWLVLCQFSPS